MKVAYPWAWSSTTMVSPYVGAYADYYFSSANAAPLALASATPVLLPTEVVQGWAARITSGVAVQFASGRTLSLDGEVGGLGNDFTVWSVRGRFAVPLPF